MTNKSEASKRRLRGIQHGIELHRRWLAENGFGGRIKPSDVKRFIALVNWENQEQMETFKCKPRWNQHWMIRNCRELIQRNEAI